MTKDILFITNSPNKVKEAQKILGKDFKLKLYKYDLDEIQTIDGKEVIRKKAKEAFEIFKNPLMVEDTSLYFDAWHGLPGALARWFLDAVNCEGICKMFRDEKNRTAWAESAIAYYDGKKLKIVNAKIKGSVPDKPRGKYKFGWDPIFIPEGFSTTFAEMGAQDKSEISSRKLALEKLRDYLNKNV